MSATRYRSVWLCLSWLVIASLWLPPNVAAAFALAAETQNLASLPSQTTESVVQTQDLASLPAQTVTVTNTDTVTATEVVTITPTITDTTPLTATGAVTVTPAITDTTPLTATGAVTVTPAITDTAPLTTTGVVTVTPTITDTAPLTAADGVTEVAGIAAAAGGGSSGIYGGWQLTYNAPTVALFRGAATYNYPIELPAARGRFQPALNVSYNSSRVDGILSLVDSEWVGLGWSVDLVDIVRTDVGYAFEAPNTQWLKADNNFTLLLNGAGYELVAAAGVVDHGRYYAGGAPDLYGERVNDCSDDNNCATQNPNAGANKTKEYWVVRTADGTFYRLGFTVNSEQVLYKVYNTNNSGGLTYVGRAPNYAAYRWRVDYISDVFDNVTAVTYNEAHGGAEYGGDTYRDSASLLSSIRYNAYGSGQWLTEIKFITNSVQFPVQPAWSAAPIFGKQNRLDRIEVWQNGTRQSLYQFTYAERAPLSSYPYEGLIRELRAIQRRSGDNGSGLPATTFTYQNFPNKTVCVGCTPIHELVAYDYPRMTSVANGYGARTEFSYADDGRANTTDQFFNYRVTEMRTFDGLQAIVKSPARVTYEYGARCYDQNDGGPGATNYGSLCRGLSTLNPIGPLAGHATVTARSYGYDGALLTRATHSYYTDDSETTTAWRRALEYRSQLYDGDDALKQQTDTTWDHTDMGSAWFTHPNQIDTARYQGGATTTSAVAYNYDGYNHPIVEFQYGDTTRPDDDRTLHRQYSINSNVNVWIVNTVSRERVYRGIVASDAGGANLKTETLNYYDGNGTITLPPSQGRLTRVDRGGAGGTWASTVYGYDAWGNLTQTTDPKGNTTTATYETTYHQFPVQTCPPLSDLCTTTNYYGVNPAAVGGSGLFGQVQRTYASYSQDTDTLYSYDAFGRLTHEARPGDDLSSPTTRYVYHDPQGALPTLLNPGFENRVSSTNWTESDPGNVQTYAANTTQPYSGTYSLRIDAAATPDHYVYQDLSGGQAGRTYQVYAYVKTIGSAQLCLKVSGVAGHNAEVGCRSTAGAWELLIGSVTLPDNANRFRLSLNTPQGGPVYVDEVGVKELFAASAYAKENATNTLWSRQVFDGLGRVIQTQSEFDGATASVVDQRYDATGNVIAQSVPYTATASASAIPWYTSPAPNAAKTTTQYDDLGRPMQVVATNGETSRFDYYGRQTAVLDAQNHLKISAVDAYGQLIVVREYTGEYTQPLDWVALANASAYYARTRYTYDVLGNLAIVTDTLNNVTTMTYDSLGRKTAMTDPDMGAWSYAYDLNGNLTRQTDARGKRVCFYYDTLNRLTGKHYRTDNACPTGSNPSLNVAYTYDIGTYGKGQRTGMNDPLSGYTTWVYDARGRVKEERKTIIGDNGGTFVTQWDYDPMDRVTAMRYPQNNQAGIGEQVNTTYNAAGQVNGVASGFIYVNSSAYDIAGRLTQRNYGNNAFYVTYGYYDWIAAGQGRLKTLKTGANSPPNNTSLQDMTYTYDEVGNVTSIVDANTAGGAQTQSFTYDSLNRLKTAVASGGTNGTYTQKTFSYNQIGNMTNNGDGVLTYPTSGPGVARPHAVIAWGNSTYGYDANGNMTSRFDGTSTLTYDHENRLTAVSGAASASFVYDGDGNRVKSTMGGVTTYYIGNYFEWTDYESTMVKYYYTGGQRVAMKKGSVTTWLFGDHLGSTAKTAVNGSPNNTTEQRYFPWGGTRYGSSPTAFQYTGQRNDSAIGLYYYGARYYDPALGRFVQADTIVQDLRNPQTLNRYSYTGNNPMRYVDPSGHIYGPDPYDPAALETDAERKAYAKATGDTSVLNGLLSIEGVAPPDFDNPLSDGNPAPPQVEGLPDDTWEWNNNWEGLGPGYRNSEDPTHSVWRPDDRGISDKGTEGEDPHWHRRLPGRRGPGEAFPSNYRWGRGGERERPGWYNEKTGRYEYELAPFSSGPRVIPQPSWPTIAIPVGVGVGLTIWWAAKLLSPACGPFALACAVAF